MAEVEDTIIRVGNKLQQLLRQFLLVQKENEKLKETLKNLQQNQEQEVEEINRLKHQVSILKTSIGQMTELDKKVFDKQITQYVKEIDKCIGLLSE